MRTVYVDVGAECLLPFLPALKNLGATIIGSEKADRTHVVRLVVANPNWPEGPYGKAHVTVSREDFRVWYTIDLPREAT